MEFEENRLKEWFEIFYTFKDELIKKNRFFLSDQKFLEHLKEIVDVCTYNINPDQKLYRARIFNDYSYYKTTYSTSEMGAPPAEKAIGGRVNPDGISYLYLATNKDTAITEVRPWEMANINIATFTVIESIKVFYPFRYLLFKLSR